MAKVEVGDRVRFSSDWLRNTGQYTGDICFAVGIVKWIPLRVGDTRLCELQWPNGEDLPIMVLEVNLEVIRKGR